MNLMEALNRRPPKTITEIARAAEVSRGTVYSVRRDPYGSTLDTVRRVLAAMGYEVQLTISKIDAEDREEMPA